MTKRSRTLLPCPFCGHGARTRRAPFGEGGYVVAHGRAVNGDPQACPLDVRTDVFRTRSAAWSAWNRRAPTASNGGAACPP